ncbi:MAG: diaminopimelate epimerase [Pyrinomonadaceae bacterium]
MSPIEFSKFHGFGNDYIVVEKSEAAVASISEFAKAICRRHTGAGADGVAILSRLESGADYFCEIINPDGTIAGFSGNGTRCAVAYLYKNCLWSARDLKLETKSGAKNYHLLRSSGEYHYTFEAEIGKPAFSATEIPFASAESSDVIDRDVKLGDAMFTVSCVNVGNPVACIFVDDFAIDWRSAGRSLETNASFPERANIVFVKIIDRENIEIRIWERGAGETSASGTCASASAVLSAYTGRTQRQVDVRMEGGVSTVVWRNDDEIVLTGSAEFVYSGEWPAVAA